VEKKAQKPPVDWDRMPIKRNEQDKLAAEAQRRRAVEKAAAGVRRWEEIERQKKQEEREYEAIRQREKAEKWKKAEEVERRANADRLLAEELHMKEAAKHANEAKRPKAFGPPGVGLGGSEPQRQPHAWPNGANRQNDGSRPQAKPLERKETYPIAHRPAGNKGQQRDTPARNARNKPAQLRPKPKRPAPAPLTVENLRAQEGNFVDQQVVSELNRPLGDMTRTFIDGFRRPSELESKIDENFDEEESPNKRNRYDVLGA
jgi:hypothetical protein